MAPDPGDHVQSLVERARKVLPDSGPFASVLALRHDDGPYPHLGERADGARFWDIAGNEYVDWFLGGGPVVLGHRHPAVQAAVADQLERGANLSLRSPLEVEVAERLCALIPGAEQVSFAKNGTDVTSATVRLARSITGRDHVLISGYHGFADWSKGVVDDCAGIPTAVRGLVHEFGYNDPDEARRLLDSHRDQVAAIVVEPVRYADLDPAFLPTLRELADRHGCLLVFDEVVTGFRVACGGAQALSGVPADLVCLAKGLANGMPLAALVGPRRFMQQMAPTQFSMTYRRDALSLAAARAALDVHADQDVCSHLAEIGEQMRRAFAVAAQDAGLAWSLDGHPSMLHLHAPGHGRLTDLGAVSLFAERCQHEGVYLEPYRVLASLAHTPDDVERSIEVMARAMAVVSQAAEQGLDGIFDSPVGEHLQWPKSAAPAPWTSEVVPCPFPALPPALVAGGLRLAWPAGSLARAAVDGGTLVLRAATSGGAGGASATCSATIVRAVMPPFRVTARYRITVDHDDPAEIAVDLEGARRGAVPDRVTAWSALAQPPTAQAVVGGTFRHDLREYGVREGMLGFVHDGTAVRAQHRAGPSSGAGAMADEPDELASAAADHGPTEILVRLRVERAIAPVSVEITELVVEASGIGDPVTGGRRRAERLRAGARRARAVARRRLGSRSSPREPVA